MKRFSHEHQLHLFIMSQWQYLFPCLFLLAHEYDIPGCGRADFLAVDLSQYKLYIIEVKNITYCSAALIRSALYQTWVYMKAIGTDCGYLVGLWPALRVIDKWPKDGPCYEKMWYLDLPYRLTQIARGID